MRGDLSTVLTTSAPVEMTEAVRPFDFAQDDSGGTARGDGRDKAQGKGLLFFLGGYVYFGTVEGQGYLVIFTAE